MYPYGQSATHYFPANRYALVEHTGQFELVVSRHNAQFELH